MTISMNSRTIKTLCLQYRPLNVGNGIRLGTRLILDNVITKSFCTALASGVSKQC